MTLRDYFILIWIGAGFIVLGLASIGWGRHEEKRYYEDISARRDVREFVTRWPERPQPKALKIGGYIAIALGLVMVATGVTLWLLSGIAV